MVTSFHRPRDAAEALKLLSSEEGALALAGGTQLLSSEFKAKSFPVVALAGILESRISSSGDKLSLGAGATFQDLVDSPLVFPTLKAAVRGMADRNIRNRATIGGNLGADKSCSSLIPLLLALDADLDLADGRRIRLEDWLGLEAGISGRGIITIVSISSSRGLRSGYARWTRVSCDISILGVGVAYRLESGLVKGLRLVLGGMAPRARRFPLIEKLFEGKALPDREALEALVAPLLDPISDPRASAAFKRLRMAGLIAEALLGASETSAAKSPEATK